MIQLSKVNDAIVFTFTNSDYYLFGNGAITCPVNSLTLVIDDSSAATFYKAASQDIFVSAPITEFGMTVDQLETWFKNNACSVAGGSSIKTMYVGCSSDTVDASTGVITHNTCPKQDNLNIVYQASDGTYSMVHVSLGEFILENEFASGLTVNASGTVYGVVDPRSEWVITTYDASGNPSSSATVLSVNESGFTVDNIQEAIDAKFNLVKNYEISGGTNITVSSDTSDPLVTKLEIINDLDLRNGSGTNSITNLDSFATGNDSFAFGLNAHAEGANSAAFGLDGKAKKSGSFAVNGIADGVYSTAMGFNTIASGAASVAINDNTVALNDNELAAGSFNESHKENDTFGSSGNTLFSIGNGIGDSDRHNAFEIMQNGDVYIQSGGSAVLLQDVIGKIDIDDHLDSASTNPVMNSVVTEALDTKQKKNIELTQDAYDQLVSAGTVDPEVLYIISDSDPIDLNKFVTSGSISADTSAYTLTFFNEADDELFNVKFNKGGGIADVDPTLDSGSTNAVANSAITIALDDKMDKQNYLNNRYPKGSIYITYEYKNPSDFLGGSWSLIGGQDSGMTYWPAFAIDTDSAGTEISESLPNISGVTGLFRSNNKNVEQSGTGVFNADTTYGKSGTNRAGSSLASDTYNGYIDFDASRDNAIYQNGAHVQVNSIKLFFWKRDDDALVIDAISAITVADVVESGNSLPVSSEAVFDGLETKIDKESFISQLFPQGSIYTTYENINPSNFLGGQWELIGGQDSGMTYYPAFAIDTDSAGTTISESLPNITGDSPSQMASSHWYGTDINGYLATFNGALSAKEDYGVNGGAEYANNRICGGFKFNAASGSTVSGVYQDGAHVNVNAIKLFFWRRIDSGVIIDAFSAVTVADTVESGNPLPISSDAVFDGLETKFDKQNFVNHLFPSGCVYTTYENVNPSTFLGGDWELIGGQDANNNYYPAFAIDTDSAGTEISESLPNVKGKVKLGWNDASGGGIIIDTTQGLVGFERNGTCYFNGATVSDNSHYNVATFNFAKGQVDENGNYIPESASTYQNGAHVNVNAIKLFFWRRTDNASMIEAITPLEYSITKDVLWSGSAVNGASVSLTNSLNDYDTIEFNFDIGGVFYSSYDAEPDKVVEKYFIPIAYDSAVNRYFSITSINADKTNFTIGSANATLIEVRGIKTSLIPTDRPYHSVKKLSPSVTWGSASQTNKVCELWEEVTDKHHHIYGSVRCLWTGGTQSTSQVLTICTLANIPLPSAPSFISGSIYKGDSDLADICEGFLFTDGTIKERVISGWSNLTGWTLCINIDYSWDEI